MILRGIQAGRLKALNRPQVIKNKNQFKKILENSVQRKMRKVDWLRRRDSNPRPAG